MHAFPLTSLATLVAAAVYIWTLVNVGSARVRTGFQAPAVSGNEEFERYYRVQMNTVEQIVVLIPLLGLCAAWVGDFWGAVGGLTWSLGRVIYARAYYTDPKKRGPGFGISALPILAMLIAVLVAAARSLV